MTAPRDDLPEVAVDTSDVAAVRTPPGLGAFTSVYALAYSFGVIAFVAISVYANAWQYRSVGVSFLLAALWVVPFLVLAHVLHLVLFRGRRRVRTATARRAAVRIADAATAVGYPDLPVELLASRLLQDDDGPVPYTGSGREQYQPLRMWELATADPSVVVTVTRDGAPERTRVRAATTPARRDGVQLLGAYRSDVPTPLVSSRFGGLPAVPDGFVWPRCAAHDELMQFTAQLEDRGSLVLVFLCQAEAGTCASRDPDSGCNAAFVTGGRDLHLAEPPASPSGTALVPGEPWLLGVRATTRQDHLDAVIEARADGVTVAGQWGGRPAWIQGDETPPGFRFLAMLDAEPLGSNSGAGAGGAAYVFVDDHGHARVLTQS